MTFSRRKFGSLALSLSGIALLAGCGSGGDGMATTRKRVQTIDRALGSRSAFDPILMITGASGGAMADSLGTFLGSNDMPPIGLGGTAYSRAKATTRATTNSAFYYDGYLKLWAQRTKNDTETTSEVRYDFFVDEAKTQSGGFMTSLQPKWNYYYDKPTPEAAGASDLTIAPPIFWNPTYPQTYKTEYKFTAGTMAGSHGLSETTTEADYSTTSKYENVYADGWKDSGNSRSDMSSSTWSSRIDTPDGKFAEAAGTYRGAIGGSRMSSSDGYSADYQFSSSGSGHGKISGPDPGLPVTSSWDANGNVVIRYADGTTETLSRYGNPIPLPGPVAGGDRPIPVEPDGGIGNAKGG